MKNMTKHFAIFCAAIQKVIVKQKTWIGWKDLVIY